MSYYAGYEHGRTPDGYFDYYNYNTTSSYNATSPTSSGGTSMPASSPTDVFGSSTSGSYSTQNGYYPIPSDNYSFPSGPYPIIWDRQSMSRTSESYKKTELLHCLHGDCEYQTSRQYDLDRHLEYHCPSNPPEKFDCTIRGCDRTGEHAFSRKDHLKEHLRTVHAKDIPKQGRRRSKHESKPDGGPG